MPRTLQNLTPLQKVESKAALSKAIKHFGSQGKLAKKLGIARQSITEMANGKRNIPLHHAVKIENLSQGVVKKSHLRPDIF